ncbi:MAG: hypothetical protein H0V79_06080 [Actinobacteria bacterium]|nr:hypothetical protein [Actinomycetota bacterium]
MALRLPEPMLARSGRLPTGDYSFELKWDAFRALVTRNGDFRARSRRGWDMTAVPPALRRRGRSATTWSTSAMTER